LRHPIKKWAAAAAMLAGFAYLMISGAAFATVRSLIMISIMFLAVLLDRPALALRNVILAATLILVLFPESLFDVGFQMSFAAVLALVSIYEALRARALWTSLMEHTSSRIVVFFAGIVLSTLIASAAVAPFAAYHFHKSQQYAVIANLIALPVCNVLVMPAALIAMPFGLEALPLRVMGWGIEAMVWVANRVAEIPGAVLRVPAMPTAAFVLMIAGGLWLMLWRTRWRLAGIALIAGGAALAPTLRAPDIIIGRDAELVAVRGPDGELSAVGATRASFELERWLEHDGARRSIEEAAKAAAFACDGIGCRASVKGLTVAVATPPPSPRIGGARRCLYPPSSARAAARRRGRSLISSPRAVRERTRSTSRRTAASAPRPWPPRAARVHGRCRRNRPTGRTAPARRPAPRSLSNRLQ
jgi:competence protein ComEC